MGRSYYVCDGCKDTYPDDSEYVIHCSCERAYCDVKCAEKYGWHYDEKTGDDEIDFDDYGEIKSSCDYCSNKIATDEDLLVYILELLNKSRSEIEKDYLASLKGN